jgi:alpha-mannosidase
LIRKGAGIPEAGYEFTSEKVIILACKPTDDQNGIMMTLYNPTMTAAEFELKLSGGKKVFRCDTGENVLGEIPAKSRLDGQEVLTIRF